MTACTSARNTRNSSFGNVISLALLLAILAFLALSMDVEANNASNATIDSITPQLIDNGSTVTFTGHGNDTDGNVTGYFWRSSIDGNLSTSASFSATNMSVGNHTIYFKVKDNNGTWSSEVSSWLEVNSYPTATIDSITPQMIDNGTTVTFTGHGNDTDGNITGYSWRSSIDEGLSNSASFSATNMSVGNHTIYFKVKDDNGTWSSEVSSWLEVNSNPVATIDSITPQLIDFGSKATFTGHGNDTDGNITGYSWRSSIDEGLSNSASFSATNMSVGNHTIYFKVKDDNGTWSPEASSWLKVNSYPTATINSITPNPADYGDTVSFSGSGSDSDGTITGYSWRSSINGVLSTSASFSTTELSAGSHTIYFKVKDDNGTWSPEVWNGLKVFQLDDPTVGDIVVNRTETAKIYANASGDYFEEDDLTITLEYQLYRNLTTTPMMDYTLTGTDGGVRFTDISSDGKYFVASDYYVSSSTSRTKIDFFDISLQTKVWTLVIIAAINDMDLSDDGTRLVMGISGTGHDKYKNRIIVVDTNAKTLGERKASILWKYETGSSVESVSITDNGKFVAAGSGGYVYFFNVSAVDPIDPDYVWRNSVDYESYRGVVVSGDGSYVAAVDTSGYSSERLYLFEADGDQTWYAGSGPSVYYTKSIAISHDGSYIVVGGYYTALWSKSSSTALWYTQTSYAYEAYISDDGEHILSSTNSIVRAWDKDSSTPLWSKSVTTSSVTLSSDGTTAVIAHNDRDVMMYDFRTGSVFRSFDENHWQLHHMAISSNGEILIGGSHSSSKLLVFSRHNVDAQVEYPLSYLIDTNMLHFSNDDSVFVTIVYSGYRINYYYTNATSYSWTVDHGDPINSMDISGDGSYVVVGADDDRIRLYLRNGSNPWHYEAGGDVLSVAISDDGEYVVAGSEDNNIYVLERDGGVLEWSYGAGNDVVATDISSNGSTVAAVAGSKLFVFTATNGTPLWYVDMGVSLTSVSVSKDGNRIYAAGSNKIALFQRSSNSAVWTATIDETASRLSISDDGSYAAVSAASSVYLFGSAGSTPVWKHTTGSTVNSVSVSGDGAFVTAGSNDRYIHYFSTASAYSGWSYETLYSVKAVALSSDGQIILAGENYRILKMDGGQWFDFLLSTPGYNSDCSCWVTSFTPSAYLEEGIHRLRLKFTTSAGLATNWTYANITISNRRPVGTITAVTPSKIDARNVSTIITFSGTARDYDGTITDFLWTSSIDGDLSTVLNFTMTSLQVSSGNHTINLTVKDHESYWSAVVSTTIYVNYHPTANITNVTPNPGTASDNINFTGAGTDIDGTISAYEWSFDNNIELTSVDENTLGYWGFNEGSGWYVNETAQYMNGTLRANGYFTGYYYNLTSESGTPGKRSTASDVFTGVQNSTLIDIDWELDGAFPNQNINYFAVTWIGVIEAPVAGTYEFRTLADDGVILYIDGAKKIDRWTCVSSPTNNTASVSLSKGFHSLELRYGECTGDAEAHLYWTIPVLCNDCEGYEVLVSPARQGSVAGWSVTNPTDSMTDIWYPMDEGSGSYVYNQDNCTNCNPKMIRYGNADWVDGWNGSGYAMEFDGSSDALYTNDCCYFYNHDDFTVELSFKTDTDDGGVIASSNYYSGCCSTYAQHDFTIWMESDGSLGAGFYGRWDGSGSGWRSVEDDGEWNDGDWHHLVVTWDTFSYQGDLIIYVDGEVVAAEYDNYMYPRYTGSWNYWRLGTGYHSHMSASDEWWEGTVDNFRFSRYDIREPDEFLMQFTESFTMDPALGVTLGPIWSSDGASQNSLKFDGVRSYMEVPCLGNSTCSGRYDYFTAEAFVKLPVDFAVKGVVVGGGYQGEYKLGVNKDRYPFFNIRMTNGNWYSLTGTTAIPLEEWRNIAGTYNVTSNSIKLYLDGVLQTNATIPSEYVIQAYVSPTRIGMHSTGLDPFYGHIDAVRITGTDLSPAGMFTRILSHSASFTNSDFPLGNHTVYFRVKDNDGAWSERTTVVLTIINNPPVAHLSSHDYYFAEDDTVTINGTGTDIDGEIVAYRWISSIDGTVGTQRNLSTTSLTYGNHTISFKVKDDIGEWSPNNVTWVFVDDYPVATIDSVTPNPAEYGANVTFNGTASDNMGYITVYEWTSDRDGVISTSSDFVIANLSLGNHTITFKVKDNASLWSQPVTLVVNATYKPTAEITSISPVISVYGQAIVFNSTSSDQDGNITTRVWHSSIDGQISTQSNFTSSNLSVGAHLISFRVRDNLTMWSEYDTEYINVTYRPTASITSISPAPAEYGTNVTFTGSGSDSDGTITAYLWTSDRDGNLSTSRNFTTDDLTLGMHLISFTVGDNQSVWSFSKTTFINVTYKPNSTINGITPTTGDQVAVFYFNGSGSDNDGTITAYQWRSNYDGIISTSAVFNTTSLTCCREHNVSFRVKDNVTMWSDWTYYTTNLTVYNGKPVANITYVSATIALVETTLTFNGTGTDDVLISLYRWYSVPASMSFNSTQSNVSHAFNNTGTYVIYFLVSDNNGTWSNLTSANIRITGPPTVYITNVTPSQAEKGANVTFTGNATDDGNITTYQWFNSTYPGDGWTLLDCESANCTWQQRLHLNDPTDDETDIWYPMDEGSGSYVYNQDDCTNCNPKMTRYGDADWVDGWNESGYAMEFDGSSDALYTSDCCYFQNSEDFTVELSFKTDTDEGGIIATSTQYSGCCSSHYNYDFMIWMESDGSLGAGYYGYYNGGSSIDWVSVEDSGQWNDGAWHHLVVTWDQRSDSGDLIIYVDGEVVAAKYNDYMYPRYTSYWNYWRLGNGYHHSHMSASDVWWEGTVDNFRFSRYDIREPDEFLIQNYNLTRTYNATLMGTTNPLNFSSLEHGKSFVTFRAKDDDGYWSTNASKVIFIYSQPNATILNNDTLYLWAYDAFQFKGNGTDADGTIAQYAWDWKSDGTYDWTSTTTGWVKHYYSGGNATYVATLRVTDNHGFNTTDNVTIYLTYDVNRLLNITRSTANRTEAVTIEANFGSGSYDEDELTVTLQYQAERRGRTPLWSYDMGSQISYTALSDNGTTLVAYNYRTVRMFDSMSEVPLWAYTFSSNIFSMAVSGNGQYVVVGTDDGRVSLLNRTGILKWNSDTGGDVRAVDISATGQYIVAGSDNDRVYLFEYDDSSPSWSYQTGNNIRAVAISADGRFIVASSDDRYIYLFDRDTSQYRWRYQHQYDNYIPDVDISDDGEYLVAGGSRYMYTWDKDSSSYIQRYDINNLGGTYYRWWNHVGISGDGEVVFGAYSQSGYNYNDRRSDRLHIWDRGDSVGSYDTYYNVYGTTHMRDISITEDGSTVVVAQENSYVALIDKGSNTPRMSYKADSAAHSTAMAADGTVTFSGTTTGRVHLLQRDVILPSSSTSISGTPQDVDVSDNGNWIGIGTSYPRVYMRSADGSVTRYYDTQGTVQTVDWVSDGQYMAAGSDDDRVYLFKNSSSAPIWSYSTEGNVLDVMMSDDKTYIAAGSLDDKLYILKRSGGSRLWSYDTGDAVIGVAISYNGSYISAISGNTLYFFGISSSTPLWSKDIDYTLNSLAMSSNGTYVIVGGDDDRVRVYNSTGSLLWSYVADSDVTLVSASGSGSVIMIATENKDIIRFSVSGNEPLWTYTSPYAITDLRVSRDGDSATVSFADQSMALFESASAVPIWHYTIWSDITAADLSEDGETVVMVTASNEVHQFPRNPWGSGYISALSYETDHWESVFNATQYAGAGNYSFRVMFTDPSGSSSGWIYRYNALRLLNEKPVANITSYPTDIVVNGTTASFQGIGTDGDGQIIAYRWNSSIDGLLATSASFSTTALNKGNHTIGFRVQDSDGYWSSQVYVNVRIANLPVATINSISPTSAHQLQNVTFNGTGTGDEPIIGYEWYSNQDGLLSNQSVFTTDDLSCCYAHTISFRAKDNLSLWSNYVYGSVTIYNAIPEAHIDSISPSDIDEGDTVTFTGSGTDADGTISSYNWYICTDGSSSCSNYYTSQVSVSSAPVGTHDAKLRVKDNDGTWSSWNTTTYTVDNVKPVATISSISPTVPNEDQTITFTGSGSDALGSIASYRWWSSPSGLNCEGSGCSSTTHAFSSYGDYTIYFKVKDDEGVWSDTKSAALHVNRLPSASIDDIDPSPAEYETTVSFEGSGTDPDNAITAYQWYSSIDGSLSTQSEFSTDDLSYGLHNITFRVQSNDSIWSSYTYQLLRIYVLPVAYAGVDVSVRTGETVQLLGQGTDLDGGIVNFEWDFDGNGIYDWSSTVNGLYTIRYNRPGTYTAVLRVTDNTDVMDTDTVNITVMYSNFTTPFVRVTWPNGGENLMHGENYTVTWDITGDLSGSQPVSIYYSLNGGLDWTTIVSGTENDGYHVWSVPSNQNIERALIRLTASGLDSNIYEDTSDGTFSIDPPEFWQSSDDGDTEDTEPPVITLLPLPAATAGEPFRVRAEVSDETAVTQVALRYRAGDGEPVTVAMSPAGDGLWELVLLPEAGNLEITIIASDGQNVVESQSLSIMVHSRTGESPEGAAGISPALLLFCVGVTMLVIARRMRR